MFYIIYERFSWK